MIHPFLLYQESLQNQKTFVSHRSQAWYIGPAIEHYRCYKVYVPITRGEYICDTVSFHSHLYNTPVQQPLEQVLIKEKNNHINTTLRKETGYIT